MQAALKISSPVSSFMPFVEASCEGVGCCANAAKGRKKSRTRNKEKTNFMRRRIQQNFRRDAAQIVAAQRTKKTEIILNNADYTDCRDYADSDLNPRNPRYNDYRASIPVLSPKLSFFTPSLSSMPSSRFDIGVCGGMTMWRLPSSAPPAPPTRTSGRGSWSCWLPLLMLLP